MKRMKVWFPSVCRQRYRTGDYAGSIVRNGRPWGRAKFDRITPDEKIALAHVKKVVDKAMANEIYIWWRRRLFCQGHGREEERMEACIRLQFILRQRFFMWRGNRSAAKEHCGSFDDICFIGTAVYDGRSGSMGEKEIEKEIMSARL